MYNYGWDSDNEEFIEFDSDNLEQYTEDKKYVEDRLKSLGAKAKKKGYLTKSDLWEAFNYAPIYRGSGEQHIYEAEWYTERYSRAVREATELYYKILNGEA